MLAEFCDVGLTYSHVMLTSLAEPSSGAELGNKRG